MDNIPTNSQIYPNVLLGKNPIIGLFVILGEPPRGSQGGEKVTLFGDNAVVRSHSVIYAGNSIGHNFQTGHGVMIREDNEIGNDVSVGTHSIIEHHVKIADGVRFHSNVFVPEYTVMEKDVWVGPNVVLTNALYPRSVDVKKNLKGPHLLRGAKIGANVTILPGITIGKHALIGAGSVVTRDVPDYAVLVGNPARVVKYLNELGVYTLDESSVQESE